jgi:hypothetical protein
MGKESVLGVLQDLRRERKGKAGKKVRKGKRTHLIELPQVPNDDVPVCLENSKREEEVEVAAAVVGAVLRKREEEGENPNQISGQFGRMEADEKTHKRFSHNDTVWSKDSSRLKEVRSQRKQKKRLREPVSSATTQAHISSFRLESRREERGSKNRGDAPR